MPRPESEQGAVEANSLGVGDDWDTLDAKTTPAMASRMFLLLARMIQMKERKRQKAENAE